MQVTTNRLLLIIAGVVSLWLLPAASFAIADQGGPKIGDAPPALKLSGSVQGPPSTEISWPHLKGKVVVLEFWATWCGPCVKTIPHLNSLVEEFKDKPDAVIAAAKERLGLHLSLTRRSVEILEISQ